MNIYKMVNKITDTYWFISLNLEFFFFAYE